MKQLFRSIKNRIRPARCKWPIKKLIKADLNTYKTYHGYEMDINNPQSFTEKIQWYKLFYNKKELVNIVDKYLFKDYIKDKLGEGYTTPIYGYWTSVKELEKDWDKLPEEFCLKSTISSEAMNIKMIHNKSSVNFYEFKKELKGWLKQKNTMLDSYCCAYYHATPGILAEQYLENIKNQLYDYKIFCFNGKPFCFYGDKEHFEKKDFPIVYYDLNWNKINVRYGNHQTGDIPRPKHLEEMIDLAKRLSVGFPFVRVDYFDTDEKLLIAEMTLYPGGGFSPYYPKRFNESLGKLFELPIK